MVSVPKPESVESTPSFIGRMFGVLVCLIPAFLSFLIAWLTISLIGIIIFIGFPLSAIFLDTLRWVHANYNSPNPDPDFLRNRLRKASMILIHIFEIMADLKQTQLNDQKNDEPQKSDEISKV